MNSIACSICLILFLSLSLVGVLATTGYSQSPISAKENFLASQLQNPTYFNAATDTTWSDRNPGLPNPKSVMFKSMMIPGWGQVANDQIWKVPIVYGLLGGLGWYSVRMTKRYHDYRAAFYNLNPKTPDDMKFGPTPGYISQNANTEQLRSIRNKFRNRRDLIYVGIFLAYGLNIVDAFVYAHMRSFDVSDDLSLRTNIGPTVTAQAAPGFSLSIDFVTR
ncbi:hypothetical protein LX73_0338 [Fodinibius salinus]|uniref:DUF5683 domain-containing protein n=1 Tax=Fodinibius salinus TaxID=860790 RepID=A0A5D3YPY6_9BACT|nr:hypothetical protein LX73_0338 [Fodinibius salinus]